MNARTFLTGVFVVSSILMFAQNDSIHRTTGISFFAAGNFNYYDKEPEVALLNHFSLAMGVHKKNYMLYFSYNRGQSTSDATNGAGVGFEIYSSRAKITMDAIFAVIAKGTSGSLNGIGSLGAIISDDHMFVMTGSAAYWRRIRNSKVYFGGMPVYQYGERSHYEGGWLVTDKFEDRANSHSLALNAGLHAEEYTPEGFFISGMLLCGVSAGKWESEYIRKYNSTIVERIYTAGSYDLGITFYCSFKIGWVF